MLEESKLPKSVDSTEPQRDELFSNDPYERTTKLLLAALRRNPHACPSAENPEVGT